MRTFLNIPRMTLLAFCCLLPLAILLISCERNRGQHAGVREFADSTSAGKWKMLFDGNTTNGWRGINRESFPDQGWEIADGSLLVNAHDGQDWMFLALHT